MLRTYLLASCALIAAALMAAPAAAQTAWPKEREISIVVAVAPGSSAELAAREVARVVGREVGGTVVVKSIVGGGGLTGFNTVAQSKPDGYTIGLVNIGSLVVLPNVEEVPFSIDSFDFLGTVSSGWYGLGVGKDSPIKSIADLIAMGKTKRLTWSTDTIMNGLPMVQLAGLTGIRQQVVLTQTQPESIAQAVGGHVDVVAQSLPVMQPLMEGGTVRLLASTSPTRWPTAPNVPTLKELGYNAEISLPAGYATPKGVPKDIRDRLEAAMLKSATDPQLIETLNKFTIGVYSTTGQQFEAFLRAQKVAVSQVMAEAGLKKR